MFDLITDDDEEGDAGTEGVDRDNERCGESSHPPGHSVHHVLQGQRLLDVAGPGQDDEGRHDEDQEDALDHDGRSDSSSGIEGLGKVEEPGSQGGVDYQEDGAEGGGGARGRISEGERSHILL